MDRFKLTKQDRINQYKIIMYNVKGDLEYYTRPDTVRRLDEMGFFDLDEDISGTFDDYSILCLRLSRSRPGTRPRSPKTSPETNFSVRADVRHR